MSPERTCPDCGARLPADAPRGLCPECLMGAALSRTSTGGSAATGGFAPAAGALTRLSGTLMDREVTEAMAQAAGLFGAQVEKAGSSCPPPVDRAVRRPGERHRGGRQPGADVQPPHLFGIGDGRREPEHGITAYADLDDALQRVDAVIIATPPASHAPLALKAIAAGKHVLIEKPMATTTAAARMLIDAAAAAGVVLMPGHTFEHNAAVHKLRELVLGGHLGRLFYLDCARLNLGLYQSDGAVGLALATAAGAWVNFGLLVLLSMRRGLMHPDAKLFENVAITIFCAGVAGFAGPLLFGGVDEFVRRLPVLRNELDITLTGLGVLFVYASAYSLAAQGFGRTLRQQLL